MSGNRHTIDPDGDLILVFSPPAPEVAAGSETAKSISEPDLVETDNTFMDVTADLAADADWVEAETPDTHHVRVSSKHMALASPVFKVMLGPNFREGVALHANGTVDIPLEDDYEAFIVLANIVHSKSWSVPLKVSHSTLVELTIIVDKYELRQVVHMFSTAWIAGLSSEVPVDYKKPDVVMDWLAIAYVFRDQDIFKRMTKIVQTERGAAIENDIQGDIPVSELLISKSAANSLTTIY
jgi:hypothetical protein